MKRLFSILSPKSSYYSYDRRKKYYSKIDYYENKNCLNSIDKLNNLIKPDLSSHLEIESNSKEIKPYNLPFGLLVKKAKKRLGKPSFHLNNSAIIPKHEVLFYKTSINQFKLLIQIHFIDNKSFFICNQIYSNDELQLQDKQKIVSLITEKYCNHPLKNNTTVSIKLMDKNKNLIYTNDEFSFYVYYLTGDLKIYKILQTMQKKIKKQKEKKEALLNKKLMENL